MSTDRRFSTPRISQHQLCSPSLVLIHFAFIHPSSLCSSAGLWFVLVSLLDAVRERPLLPQVSSTASACLTISIATSSLRPFMSCSFFNNCLSKVLRLVSLSPGGTGLPRSVI